MSLSVEAAGKSDVGCVRQNNEDNLGYDSRHGIYVVCDGMGGQAAGEARISILRNFGLSGLAILAMVPSISASFRTVSSLLCMAFTCMIVVAGALGAAQKTTSPIISKDQAIA